MDPHAARARFDCPSARSRVSADGAINAPRPSRSACSVGAVLGFQMPGPRVAIRPQATRRAASGDRCCAGGALRPQLVDRVQDSRRTRRAGVRDAALPTRTGRTLRSPEPVELQLSRRRSPASPYMIWISAGSPPRRAGATGSRSASRGSPPPHRRSVSVASRTNRNGVQFLVASDRSGSDVGRAATIHPVGA